MGLATAPQLVSPLVCELQPLSPQGAILGLEGGLVTVLASLKEGGAPASLSGPWWTEGCHGYTHTCIPSLQRGRVPSRVPALSLASDTAQAHALVPSLQTVHL